MPAPRPRRHDRIVSAAARAALVEMLEPRTLLAGVDLLKDINPKTLFTTTPKELTPVGDTLYFTAQSKLWKSNGTEAGTVKISDEFGDVANLINFNGALHFTSGGRLWKTDGTATGMTAVSNGFPSPRDLVAAGSRLYFKGGDGGGDELWTSDGTPAGTHRVKDIRPGGASSDVRGVTQVGSRVFFRADDGTAGQELWTSDGTDAGTYRVKDINPGVGDSGPSFLTNVNGTLFFAASDGSTGGSGFELWKSDGTETGTVRVKDIRAGTGGSTPMMIQNVNGVVMFLATDGLTGLEIWRSDGNDAGTTLVKDIVAGTNGAMITQLTTVGNTLYFSANDGASGYELWKSDGTTTGTVRVKDLAPGAVSGNPYLFTPWNDKLFFFAHDGNSGLEPWTSDGTEAGTTLLRDIWPGPSAPNPEAAAPIGNKMYFALVEELEVTDGTAAGTVRVANPTGFTLQSGGARNFLRIDDNLAIFSANDTLNGQELWRTDGTPAGTSMLVDMTAGPGGTDLQQFHNINGTAYFLANSRLWKSDGTAAGTVMVSSTPLGGATLIPVGNTLFFMASTGLGSGLWKSDGTGAGTVLVKPDTQSYRPESYVDVNGTLFFVADDGGSGHELWKSDGTPAGTARVKDIIPGSASSGPHLLTNVNGTLFFRASDGAHGYELWKSDGTDAGTVMVRDIVAGPDGSVIQKLTAMGGTLFFTADDRINGQELWKSDGTTAGTALVKDIYAGEQGSSAGSFMVSNGAIYFRADDGIAGAELWKSDGTTAGTVLVKDIVPGPAGSAPARLIPYNGGVVFNISNGNTIWRSDGTDPGTFKVYNFLIEDSWASMGDHVLTQAWSGAGNEPIWIDPTGSPPASIASSPSSPLIAAADSSAPAPAAAAAQSSAGPATVYDATFPGNKSNTIGAGMSPMRVVYSEIFGSWMDNSIADETIVRRIAREADAAGQTIALNVEHWFNDTRFDSESVIGWSVEKMMQIIDWIHDERPNVKVGYAGQITHGAYPAPAVGTLAYDRWHASHERLRPLIDKVDILFPGVYTVEENAANWFPYADAHLAEAKLYNKPVSAFMFANYEGGYIVANRAIAPEFWRMQLDVTRELVGSATIWGPWWDDAPWYEVTRDFIADPTPLVPAPAANLVATVNQSAATITLNWQDKSYNESGFRIERVPAASAAVTFFPIATVGRNVTTFTDTTATPGIEYLYRVVATNADAGGGDAAPSNVVSARVRIAPAAPINVTASPVSSTRIRIEWQNASDDIDSFIVERSTAGQPFAQVATPAGDQLSYEDFNLQPNTTYAYRVRAVNAIGQSPPSAEASAKTLANSGLRANWRFDSAVAAGSPVIDSAGGHDGTLSNGGLFTDGKLGGALRFDGVDDYVTVPDAADLRFAATDSFTLSAWINLASLPNRAMTVLAKANGSAARYGIALDASNRWVGIGSSSLVGPTATTGWTHVAIVQNAASNYRRLYVNGVEVAVNTAQAADGAGALWIGAGEGAAGPVFPFAGIVDDVRIYDRALINTDVAAFAAPHIFIPATAGADLWSVVFSAAGDRYEFFTDNPTHAGPEFSRPIDAVGSITFNGGDGADRLIADFSRGEVMPLYGFNFTGGNGIDTLTIRGLSALDPFTVSATNIRHTLGVGTGIAHGGSEALEVLNGTFNVTANLTGKQLAVRNGATAVLAASQDLAALSIDNADVVLTAGGAKIIAAAALSITNGGSLDLSDNDLVWRNGSASSLFTMLSTGVLFTSWWNEGVSTLAFNPGSVYRDTFGGAPFSGRSIADADLVVKYTYTGDANLDGYIDAADYGVIDNFIQFPGSSGYWNGDFNYDGVIDAADYGYIDNNIQVQGAPL